MEFEWDSEKNRKNIEKHGVDFADAALIFEEPLLVHEDNREAYGERRFCCIGILNGIEIFVSYTWRENRLRIISARRASRDERRKYRSVYEQKSS